MSAFTSTTDTFGSFLKGLCGEENYDRLQELNKKPSEKSEGQNNNADSAILKPPKSDGDALHPIISGSPNLHKQKGDPMSKENSQVQEKFELEEENPNYTCQEEELPDHHFRTEIPNIIFDLDLDNCEFKVYCYLKRIAGDNGTCWKSIKSLAEGCKISERKVRYAINTLSSTFFEGIPLIKIRYRKKEDGSYDSNLISITSIWRKNGDHYRSKKSLPHPKIEGGGTAQNAVGVLHHMQNGTAPYAAKEDLSQEDPYLKKTNREHTDSTSRSSSFFDGANALDSSFSNKKKEEQDSDLDEETKAKMDFLWDFIVKQNISHGRTSNKKPGIKKTDLKVWIKKYEPIEIMDCLKRAVQAEISKTYAGYVTQLLKDQVSIKDMKMEEGRNYVQKVIDKEKMNSYIEMQKTGFKIKGDKNESVSYTLPLQTLHGILENAWKLNQQNRL